MSFTKLYPLGTQCFYDPGGLSWGERVRISRKDIEQKERRISYLNSLLQENVIQDEGDRERLKEQIRKLDGDIGSLLTEIDQIKAKDIPWWDERAKR